MKKLFVVLTALVLIVGFGIMRAEAADTAEITVTVTLQNLAVTITGDDPWVLGTMTAGQESSAQAYTATNTGNVNEDFGIKVGNSSPGTWLPGGSSAANQFIMALDDPATNLTGSNTVLATNVDPTTGFEDYTLTFTAPSSSTSDVQQSILVTVTATATTP